MIEIVDFVTDLASLSEEVRHLSNTHKEQYQRRRFWLGIHLRPLPTVFPRIFNQS